MNAMVARDVTWRRTTRPGRSIAPCVADLAPLSDGAQAARLVQADPLYAQVSSDAYSGSMCSMRSLAQQEKLVGLAQTGPSPSDHGGRLMQARGYPQPIVSGSIEKASDVLRSDCPFAPMPLSSPRSMRGVWRGARGQGAELLREVRRCDPSWAVQ